MKNKVKKDKSYSIRLNQKMVEKVKEKTGKSPQKIIDGVYELELKNLEKDIEDL